MGTTTTTFAVFIFFLTITYANAEVTFEWATIGNPGNLPDRLYPHSNLNPDNLQFGAVDYVYRISKYEVTNAQYTAFLNAVDPIGDNPNNIYDYLRINDLLSGIDFDAEADSGAKYSVKPFMGNKPVNYVSIFDAMRFANWLENGQPTDGSGTETGVYNLSDRHDATRAPGATYFIPTEDEWYKAAYHDPRPESAGGPPGDDNYWLYPTSSDVEPIIATANKEGDINNPGINVANYNRGANWNGSLGNFTTVGSAGAGSTSFYGAFDQAGNVWEWNETAVPTMAGFGARGGAFGWQSAGLAASFRTNIDPARRSVGFRVASIPEPSSVLLVAFATGGLLVWRRR